MKSTREKLLEEFYDIITPNKQEMYDRIAPDRIKHLTVVMENMYQPHNASAVVRSCDLFGIQDLHIIEDEFEYQIDPEIAKGASQWIDIHQYTAENGNATTNCFNTLRKNGYKVVATTPHKKSVTLQDLDLTQKTAIVFGTEWTGLSDTALEEADEYVHIPMYGFTESFNVSVSAALVMNTLRSRLEQSNIDYRLSKEEITDIKIEWCKLILRNGAEIERRLLQKISD